MTVQEQAQADVEGASKEGGADDAVAKSEETSAPENLGEAAGKSDGEDVEKTPADADENKGTIPDSPDGYDFSLPEDLGLKDEKGDPLQFTADDPFVAQGREIASKYGLSQEAVSELVGLYGQVIKDTNEAGVAAQKELAQQRTAEELGKLKTTDADGNEVSGEDRVRRLLASVNSAAGDGASSILKDALTNAAMVEVLEKLIARSGEEVGKSQSGESKHSDLRGRALLEQAFKKS